MAKPVERVVKQDVRNNFVKRYQNLVYFVANQYKQSGIEWEDLVQTGFVGLLKAINRYNPFQSVKFSTFAVHYIQGEILHELRYKKRHNPVAEVSMEEVLIDMQEEDKAFRLVDIVGTDPDEVEAAVVNRVTIEAALDCLSDSERKVITLRYGLRAGRCRTQEQVAEIMGVSQKTISQMENRAIGKLRRQMVRWS